MHVPTVMVVTVGTVGLATVHTDGVAALNNTGSPSGGDTDADRVTDVPTVTSGGWTNVITGEADAVVPASLTEAVSQAFCTFADGLVSW